MSTECGKEHEHEDRESRDLYQAKNEAALAIKSNTEDMILTWHGHDSGVRRDVIYLLIWYDTGNLKSII